MKPTLITTSMSGSLQQNLLMIDSRQTRRSGQPILVLYVIFPRQPVVDLIGHVNKEIGPFLEAGGDFADYVDQKQLCYLMLYATVGEAGIDFAEEMDLKNDHRFSLITEAKFEISVDDWRLGSEPLRNYMPAVEVYRVDWNESDLCEGSSINE